MTLLRLAKDEAFVDPGVANVWEKPNTTDRGFFYVPAPPSQIKTVTLAAGAFGDLPNIPIQ